MAREPPWEQNVIMWIALAISGSMSFHGHLPDY